MITDTIQLLKTELLESYMNADITNPEEAIIKASKIKILDSVTDSLLVHCTKKGTDISYTTMMVQLKTELDLAVLSRDTTPEGDILVEILNYYYTKFLEYSSVEGNTNN